MFHGCFSNNNKTEKLEEWVCKIWAAVGGGGGVGGKGVNNVHSGLCENGELKNTFNRKLLWSYFITIKIP